LSIVPFLILPLVGGYAFSTIWHPSLYHAARESGHRLYLRAVFYAFVITLLVTFIHIIVWETENYQYLYSLVAYTLGEHNASITNDTSKVFVLILTIPFGIFLGHFLNLNKWMTWLKIPERV